MNCALSIWHGHWYLKTLHLKRRPPLVNAGPRCLFYQPMDEKIETWPLCFPAKENPNVEKALFDWPVVLQYDVKAKYRLISRTFSGIKFFHPSVRLTNQMPRAFDKPIKSPYIFRSFVVSVLFVFISRSYKIALTKTSRKQPPLIKSKTTISFLKQIFASSNKRGKFYSVGGKSRNTAFWHVCIVVAKQVTSLSLFPVIPVA